ncbi:MAG TPA: hypothetical protein DCP92_10930 [Nitrospiraceae bacterium]|nr:hypothetical protein [Nitrospiraceae bacterium]
MKLFPAALVICLVFLAGLLLRGVTSRNPRHQHSNGSMNKKAKRTVTIFLLLFVAGLLFRIMGKIALLLGIIILILSALTFRKK